MRQFFCSGPVKASEEINGASPALGPCRWETCRKDALVIVNNRHVCLEHLEAMLRSTREQIDAALGAP